MRAHTEISTCSMCFSVDWKERISKVVTTITRDLTVRRLGRYLKDQGLFCCYDECLQLKLSPAQSTAPNDLCPLALPPFESSSRSHLPSPCWPSAIWTEADEQTDVETLIVSRQSGG
jgi:hypothetical protein